MGLFKRGNMWYMEFVVGGERIQRSTNIRIDEPYAVKKAEDVEKQVKKAMKEELKAKKLQAQTGTAASEEGKSKPAEERIKLSQAIDRTYTDVWKDNKDSKNPLQRMNTIKEILGDMYLDEIQAKDISRIQSELKKKGLSDPTVNRYKAALRTVLNLAHKEWEVINRVPNFNMKKESVGRTRYMTYEEEENLLQYLAERNEDDLIDLFSVLLDTGMRFSEANELSYKDNIDTELELITVWINKGGKPKSVPMTSRVKDILLKRRCIGNHPFKVSYWHAEYIFDKWKESAGLEDSGLVIHCMRHTTASRLVQEDIPLPVVRDLLGHSTIQMTERYAHLSPSRLKSAISVLDKKPAQQAI